MKRVIKTDGIIIWIDSALENYKTYDNEGKLYFKSISSKEMLTCFKGCKIKWYPKIYLKPKYLNVCRKFSIRYFIYVINRYFFKKNISYYGQNEFIKFILNRFDLFKSHTVAVIKK